jgi:hypothetical protein
MRQCVWARKAGGGRKKPSRLSSLLHGVVGHSSTMSKGVVEKAGIEKAGGRIEKRKIEGRKR